MFTVSKQYINQRCGLHLAEYQQKDPITGKLGIIDSIIFWSGLRSFNWNGLRIARCYVCFDNLYLSKIFLSIQSLTYLATSNNIIFSIFCI